MTTELEAAQHAARLAKTQAQAATHRAHQAVAQATRATEAANLAAAEANEAARHAGDAADNADHALTFLADLEATPAPPVPPQPPTEPTDPDPGPDPEPPDVTDPDPGPDPPTTPAGHHLPPPVGVNPSHWYDTPQGVTYDGSGYQVAPDLAGALAAFDGLPAGAPDGTGVTGPLIRPMDWQRTNDAVARRTVQDQAQPSGNWTRPPGVSLGAIVALCNALKAHPHLTFGHESLPDVYAWTAGYLAANLWPGSTVFIEYTNEHWNTQFSQADYCLDRGNLPPALHSDQYAAASRYYGRRSLEAWLTFGASFPRERTIRVLGSQASNAWRGQMAALYVDDQGRRVADEADALALAPYFGRGVNLYARDNRQADVDALLDRAEADVPNQVGHVAEHVALAGALGIAHVMAYEAGTEVANTDATMNDDDVTRRLREANRHPRMGAIYADYLRRIMGAGLTWAELYLMAYKPTDWGDWGLVEDLAQDPRPPKWQHVTEAARELNRLDV